LKKPAYHEIQKRQYPSRLIRDRRAVNYDGDALNGISVKESTPRQKAFHGCEEIPDCGMERLVNQGYQQEQYAWA
jgi:hypothetical protein